MGFELSLLGIAAVAIPFLVNLIKKVKFIGSKYAPVVAFALGAIVGLVGFRFGFLPEGTSIIQALMLGIGVGGTSTGLYDVTKKLSGK